MLLSCSLFWRERIHLDRPGKGICGPLNALVIDTNHILEPVENTKYTKNHIDWYDYVAYFSLKN